MFSTDFLQIFVNISQQVIKVKKGEQGVNIKVFQNLANIWQILLATFCKFWEFDWISIFCYVNTFLYFIVSRTLQILKLLYCFYTLIVVTLYFDILIFLDFLFNGLCRKHVRSSQRRGRILPGHWRSCSSFFKSRNVSAIFSQARVLSPCICTLDQSCNGRFSDRHWPYRPGQNRGRQKLTMHFWGITDPNVF